MKIHIYENQPRSNGEKTENKVLQKSVCKTFFCGVFPISRNKVININLKETGRCMCKDLVAKASKRTIKVPLVLQIIVKIRLDIKPED